MVQIIKFLGVGAMATAIQYFLLIVLGGVQLLSIGVLGEYIAKVYLETKRRPRYIIQQISNYSLSEK